MRGYRGLDFRWKVTLQSTAIAALALVVALVLLISLGAACSSDDGDETSDLTPQTSTEGAGDATASLKGSAAFAPLAGRELHFAAVSLDPLTGVQGLVSAARVLRVAP